jgi:hypothetical protein
MTRRQASVNAWQAAIPVTCKQERRNTNGEPPGYGADYGHKGTSLGQRRMAVVCDVPDKGRGDKNDNRSNHEAGLSAGGPRQTPHRAWFV